MGSPSPSPEPPLRIPPAKMKFDPVARASEPQHCPVADVRNKGRVECAHCHRLLPFDQFESLTDPQCSRCRREAVEREIAEIKARACQDFSKELADAAAGRVPLDRLESFLSELVYNFGGMRAFVKVWSDNLTLAVTKHSGERMVLDQFRSIAKLVLDCNKLQHQENVLDLSDEQLRFEKEKALIEMLGNAACEPTRRRMLVEMLRSNGITLDQVPGLPAYDPEDAAHVG